MPALIFNKINHKILVVGPIYDKIEKIDRILHLEKNYDLVIINGSLCYPNSDETETENRIKLFNDKIFNNPKILYNLGRYDWIFARQYPDHTISKWIANKSNVIIIEFQNQSTTIITNGGVTPQMDRAKLMNNIETSFVSYINGIPWHKKYSGRYGYIISNNPLTFSEPQFYPFSMCLGNKYGDETQVYAQEVTPLGLEQTILL